MLFRQNLGHADVPFEWKGDKLLARWSNEQQRHFKAGSLSPSHRSLLTRAGLRFSRSTGWCDQLAELLEFRQAQGHCSVPLRWSVNRPLGAVSRQPFNASLHPSTPPCILQRFPAPSPAPANPLKRLGSRWPVPPEACVCLHAKVPDTRFTLVSLWPATS